MRWPKRLTPWVAVILLAAGCTPAKPSGGASPTPSGALGLDNPPAPTFSNTPNPACAYAPIAIPPDASLPQPVLYPTGYAKPAATTPTTTYGFQELQNPPDAAVTGRGSSVVNYSPLVVKYSDPAKTTIAGCPLTLRTYDGGLVGPTVRVKAGQTLQFSVANNLPLSPGAPKQPTVPPTCPSGATATAAPPQSEPAGMSTEQVLDMTNLHTHGLHVDPCGKYVNGQFVASDNVLIQYGPQTQQPYSISIPAGDPPGTFWYHAHAHGSTAVQMSSGMAGALIVDDDPATTPPPLQGIPEKIMVFQQVAYDVTGTIADLNDNNPDVFNWSDPGGTPGCSDAACRRITINGQIFPKITMQPGTIQRWRMIAATYNKFMNLQLAGMSLNEVAVDSLYLPRVDSWNSASGGSVELESGQRSDVLVQAPTTPGTYMLTDSTVTGTAGVLAAVVVPPASPVANKGLPTTAQMQSIAYGWNGGSPTSLSTLWQADPANSGCPIDKVTSSVVGTPCATAHVQTMQFDVTPDQKYFAIDQFQYPTGPIRHLVLNRIDAWALSDSLKGPHVFHIHVNPFQTVRTGPDGKPEVVWRDTVVVPSNVPGTPGYSPTPLVIYTQYTTFLGGFVIHCHLVDHEDNGMMQEVYVYPS